MHLEEFKTLHALEIGELCHVWLCDLVVMCIDEMLVNVLRMWIGELVYVALLLLRAW